MGRALRLICKSLFLSSVALLSLFALYTIYIVVTPFRPTHLPPLRDGDIVFQTTYNTQTAAILIATHSIYSHMGIVHVKNGMPYVIEAAGPVREISLERWVKKGVGQRVRIMRHDTLTTKQQKHIIRAAQGFLGKPYDPFFLSGDERIYCSELVYKAFKRGAGIMLGKEERLADLHVHNPVVDALIGARWQRYPLCAGVADYAKCHAVIMRQKIVSPYVIRDDETLTSIYSNYGIPF